MQVDFAATGPHSGHAEKWGRLCMCNLVKPDDELSSRNGVGEKFCRSWSHGIPPQCIVHPTKLSWAGFENHKCKSAQRHLTATRVQWHPTIGSPGCCRVATFGPHPQVSDYTH